MCFIEKNDYRFWINIEGYDQKLLLQLQRTPDNRGYNDFFSIDRPLGRGQGTERVFTLPFREVESISYTPSKDNAPYTIRIDAIGGDYRLKEIKIEKHCFNYFEFREVQKVFKKSKEKLGL